jgi:hypothetical protein
MKVGKMTYAQLVMSLPTASEVSELIPRLGCKETETSGDLHLARAIRQITAAIVASPTTPELWRDLAQAFGLNQMLKWKFLNVAYRLQPDNFPTLTELAFTYMMLGDNERAIDLMDKIIASADNENDCAVGIEYINAMKYPESVNFPSLLRM